MRHNFFTTPVFLGSLFILGCSQDGLRPDEGERVQEEEGAIIGGTADTTHQAVVAVLGNYGGNSYECSGTVIQVKNGIGYVLTAAHCCPAGMPPNEVVVGPDYTTGVSHAIVPMSIYKDKCYLDYAGSTDDVCLLKFSGASAATQVIPVVVPPDNLGIGTAITYVGYGLTKPPYIPDPNNPGQLIPNPNAGNNSVRNKVNKTVSKVDSYFVEYANPGTSGTCQGDSGGPGLVIVSGQERVASVTSFGDQACTQLGSSIRVASVYDEVIVPYLADQAPNPTCPVSKDCNACSNSATQNGSCVNATNACFNDPQCAALVQCYQGCSSASCVNACNTQHVGGLQKYVAIESCVCTVACPTACGGTPTCTAPKCGLKSTDASCVVCADSACCAEAWECQADATCKKCFGANPPAACAGNAKAATYYQCASAKCGCAINDPANIGVTTAANSSAAATTGGDETATTGAGVGGGDLTTTTTSTVGVGGAGATTGAGTTGGGGSGSKSQQIGGCGTCAAGGGGSDVPAAPAAALSLGVMAAFARRRRRA